MDAEEGIGEEEEYARVRNLVMSLPQETVEALNRAGEKENMYSTARATQVRLKAENMISLYPNFKLYTMRCCFVLPRLHVQSPDPPRPLQCPA